MKPFEEAITSYKNVILDCDGVIIDSNQQKMSNIRSATSYYCDPDETNKFVHYFIENEGIPRELKILKFFGKGQKGQEILTRYNELNRESLINAPYTKGLKEFLGMIEAYPLDIYILSGGSQKELLNLFQQRKLLAYFKQILGGPKTKSQHLSELSLTGMTLYIGDSKKDYEVAVEFGFDFIFIYGYSSFTNWRAFFKAKSNVFIIEDLAALLSQNKENVEQC